MEFQPNLLKEIDRFSESATKQVLILQQITRLK